MNTKLFFGILLATLMTLSAADAQWLGAADLAGHPECIGICSSNGYTAPAAFPAFFWDPSGGGKCVADPAGAVDCAAPYNPLTGAFPFITSYTPGPDPAHPTYILAGVNNAVFVIDVDEAMDSYNDYKLFVIFPFESGGVSGCDIDVTNNLGTTTEAGEVVNGRCITEIGAKLLVPGNQQALVGGTLSNGVDPDPVTVTIATAQAQDNGPAIAMQSSPTGGSTPATLQTKWGLTISALSGSDGIYTAAGGVSSSSSIRTFYSGENFYVGTVSKPIFKVDLSTITGSQSVNWASLTVAQGSSGGVAYDSGTSMSLSAKKDLYVTVGNVPYAYCCPLATSAGAVSPTCSGRFMTTTKVTLDSVSYFVCAGMTNSGGASNGETNLTINDSAEGSSVATGVSVDFFAYFYNVTNGYGDTTLNDTNSNCTVYEDGGNQTMTYNSGNTRWEYTDASGYSSSGTKNWEVWCDTNATGHFGLHASDDLSVTGGATSYPEFSDFAWVLAAVLGVGSFVLMRRMRKF